MKAKLLFLFMFLVQVVLAQTGTNAYEYMPKYDPPKSPNASSFERYTSVPGNYQTGQVSPSIPLMSFTVDGLTVPLTLNYSNTGLKVADIASWVGLGWNLDATGIITRQVKGIPDDSDFGLMKPYYSGLVESLVKNELSGVPLWDYFDAVTKHIADTEHDMFTYNVLGVSGSFYIDKFDKCIQLQNSNTKIKFTKSSGGKLDTFTITDEKGHKYFFNLKEDSNIIGIAPAIDRYYNTLQSSTWYLTQIETQNGENINFEYTHYQYSKTEISESQSFTPITTGSCYLNSTDVSLLHTSIISLVNVYQPSRITWKNGYILFNVGGVRNDLKQINSQSTVPYLAGINMYETPRAFSYDPGKLLYKVSLGYLNNSRLLLKGVNFNDRFNDVTVKKYQLNYINENENSPFPSYNYNEPGFSAQDYWGYYNGEIQNWGLLPYDAISNNPEIDGSSQSNSIINRSQYIGRNKKAPNPAYSSYGMLKEIIYPTGGKSVFSYEGNIVRKDYIPRIAAGSTTLLNTLIQKTDAQNTVFVTLGGLRVSQIAFYSDFKNVVPSLVKDVSYSESNFYVGFLPLFTTYLYRSMIGCEQCAAFYTFTLQSSSVVSNPAPIVQYSSVTEYNGSKENNAGKTVHDYDYAFLGQGAYPWAPYITPYYPSWQMGERRGSQQLFNGTNVQVNQTLKTLNDPIYNSIDSRLNSYARDVKISLFRNDQCSNGYAQYSTDREPSSNGDASNMVANMYKWAQSEVKSDNYLLQATIDSTYNDGISTGTATIYNYNKEQKNLLLPNSISGFDSRGDSIKTLVKYPQDYFANGLVNSVPIVIEPGSDPMKSALLNLINKNLLAIPVEKINIINRNGVNYVVSASLYTFNINKLSISAIYTLLLDKPIILSSFASSTINSSGVFVYDSRYKLERQYYSYNSANQPLEFSDKITDLKHSMLWDYNSSYQIAEVVNAGQADIAYTSFEADGNGNWGINTTARNSTGFNGSQSYLLSSINTMTRTGLTTGKSYIVSYWTTGSSALTVAGTQANYPVKGVTINGWTYYEHLIKGQSSVTLSATSSVGIDEVRLYPQNAQMTTHTYDPLIGLTSSTNAKNQITYYEYDSFLRLINIKDQYGNITQHVDYQFYK